VLERTVARGHAAESLPTTWTDGASHSLLAVLKRAAWEEAGCPWDGSLNVLKWAPKARLSVGPAYLSRRHPDAQYPLNPVDEGQQPAWVLCLDLRTTLTLRASG
jgi:hypothetical protein